MTREEVEKRVVLIVDDKPSNLDLLISFLGKYDFDIIFAKNAEEMFKRLEYRRPNIILLDIMMPGINGFETCRRLKKNEEYRDIPVVLMSSLDDTVDKVKGLELGAVDYISKPFAHEEVLARITNHLHIQDLKNKLKSANRTLEKRVEDRTIELKITNQKLLNAYEEERTRIAMELHDGLGQGMLTTMLSLQMINRDLMNPQINNIITAMNDDINGLHNICIGLMPVLLENMDIAQAVKSHCRTFSDVSGLNIDVFVDLKSRPCLDVAENLFRILQEALCNIKKHSGSKDAKITLTKVNNNLVMKIEDTGKGFDYSKLTTECKGIGLFTMKERVAIMNGNLNIESTEQKGTKITVEVPFGKIEG